LMQQKRSRSNLNGSLKPRLRDGHGYTVMIHGDFA
jgi:hypothetical protein